MRILIAEDEKVSRFALVNLLVKWGYDVEEVSDGLEAWETFKRSDAPTLAILDWAMPGMTGVEICRRIRQQGRREYIYVILLTGREQADDMVEGFDAGVDDYVVKPYDIRELRARLRAARRILDLHHDLRRELDEHRKTEERLRQARNEAELARCELALMNDNLESIVEARTGEIERLLQQKDRFVNQLGHDLKTPLTPMVAMLPMLNDFMDSSKGREILKITIDNVSYMRNLVESTVELAQMNSSEFEMHIKNVGLAEEISGITASLQHTLDSHDVQVVDNIDSELQIEADPLRFKELFNNLITNAVKYMAGAGTITLTSRVDGDMAVVEVADTGMGMTAEQIDHVFEEFYKADPSRHDRASSGLGLSICKRIVEKHGGRIWIESPGIGQGTTVSFTMKLTAAGSLTASAS